MSRMVRVRISDSELFFPWKKDVLLSGSCSGVLPFGIIDAVSEETGFYNTEGFTRLSDFPELKAGDILTAAERILECVEICKDALIFPGNTYCRRTPYMSRRICDRRVLHTYLLNAT